MADPIVTSPPIPAPAPEKKSFFSSLTKVFIPAAVGGVGAVILGVPILAGAAIGAGAVVIGKVVSDGVAKASEEK